MEKEFELQEYWQIGYIFRCTQNRAVTGTGLEITIDPEFFSPA
jgi:hypothetical protein